MWVMSFDFGLIRIGVAISNTELKIPHPVDLITGRNKFEKMDKIAKLIQEWRPEHLVVGMPSSSEGEGKEAKEALIDAINKFANRLKHKFKL